MYVCYIQKSVSGLAFYWTQNYRTVHIPHQQHRTIVIQPFAHSLKRNDGSDAIQYKYI